MTMTSGQKMGKQIVILQRGWIMVGDLLKIGPDFYLTNGSVVRRWGTSRGLGELALEGPKSNTVLDPIPETRFHELTLVAALKCSDVWNVADKKNDSI